MLLSNNGNAAGYFFLNQSYLEARSPDKNLNSATLYFIPQPQASEGIHPFTKVG